jgi:ParB family chromosome partitioning protein
MTKTDVKEKGVWKITLSKSLDIPFNKLVLSQSNVRRVKAGVSINELAADIAHRTLLQSLTVRPVLDEAGTETGMFEVPSGGRRFRALELLVKQKRLARNAPIPCVVRTEGIAEEDSLAENVQRAPLHPLDQFRAFLTLIEKGQTEEEIAAVFFVSATVVKQRLRLASVSPKLHDIYAEDDMTLDQLMAFTVNPDHERQEQVWEAIQHSYNKEPGQIRRLLTEEAVRASDKRARYVSTEYDAAGGPIMRDLFQADDGGWLQDVGLLDRLVAEKLERDVESVRAEGWKWVETAISFPYGHTYGMRVISGAERPMTEEETATVTALQAEMEKIEETYEDAPEYPDDVAERLNEIDEALAEINERPPVYDVADIARAGAFVSIDGSGELQVQRGYVRREDEPPVPVAVDESDGIDDADLPADGDGTEDPDAGESGVQRTVITGGGAEPEEDDGLQPLSDKLLTELTAYRTLALREAIGNDPGIACLAALHALCLNVFYRYALDSCLEISAKTVFFGNHAPGLGDTKLAADLDARHRNWAEQLPEQPGELWDVLTGFDSDSRDALFAHCVSLTVNAVHEAFNRRPKAYAHAARLAETVSLDMVAVGWVPTIDNYLGRVTKARILEVVREAKGEDAAKRISHLKKGDMATEAERLLDGTGWLPEPLRTSSASPKADEPAEDTETEVLCASSETDAVADIPAAQQDDSDPQAIAAE